MVFSTGTPTAARVRKTLESVAGYLYANRSRMRYDEYLANGWPIASGPMEGACKNQGPHGAIGHALGRSHGRGHRPTQSCLWARHSHDFSGAKFIWTDDLDLDNTVILRYTAPKPAGYTKTWNADGDIDITNIVTETRMAVLPSPNLFQVHKDGLAAGYLTRVRGSQQITEQFAQSSGDVTTAIPIDLGPATEQVYLVLYGGNLGAAKTATATIGGVAAEVAYAGNLTPPNGVAQFNIAIPRALAGKGTVEVVLAVNGKVASAVTVNIK